MNIDGKLIKLGFLDDRLVETIMVTPSRSNVKSYNTAPIGVWKENKKLVSKVYDNSNTFMNLVEYGKGSLNITHNVISFAKSLISDVDIEKDMKIENSDAVIEVEVLDSIEFGNFYKLYFDPISVDFYVENPRSFCRSEGAIIEALIDATRQREKVNNSGMINHYKEIVDKTGSKKEKKIMERIEEYSNNVA